MFNFRIIVINLFIKLYIIISGEKKTKIIILQIFKNHLSEL